jgi:hypothetical protein
MTRNGRPYALAIPVLRTRVRVCSSSPSAPDACWLLPTPTVTDHNGGHEPQVGGRRPSGAKRQVDLPTVIALKICPPSLPGGTGRGRLLPTPDTGTTPNGHGRRGGRPGNGHESSNSLDAVARTLTGAAGRASPAPGASGSRLPVQWGEYEPAIRRWEQIMGRPAPPPAEPGPGGRPLLAPAFSEWLMGLPAGWVCGIGGISRTVRLSILGNGVVPWQGAALQLLIGAAAHPGMPPQTARRVGHATRDAA